MVHKKFKLYTSENNDNNKIKCCLLQFCLPLKALSKNSSYVLITAQPQK